MSEKKPIVVAVSGGFDPLHIGHVRLMQEAKALGDKLVVILNNDNWLADKKGVPFMPEQERAEILAAYDFVSDVVISSHSKDDPSTDAYHRSVARELEKIKPDIFANGGDRDEKNAADPESSLYWDIKTCEDLGIKMVFNVGHGGKVQSSSWLVQKYNDWKSKHEK
ncbi:MAG: adenylyltransferase/cytidyltransferase family protein [Patescibacteria group bacterium]